MTRRAFLAGSAAFCALPAFADPARVTIIDYSQEGERLGEVTRPKVVKTEEEWQRQLSPVSYQVTRRQSTERPYTGATWNLHRRGIYRCICCDIAQFSSRSKFDSGTGWPSFYEPIERQNVLDFTRDQVGMRRTPVSCPLCDAHLGHVFDDGPKPTGLRYCINSAAMRFTKIVDALPEDSLPPITYN